MLCQPKLFEDRSPGEGPSAQAGPFTPHTPFTPLTPFFHNPEFVIFRLNNLNHKRFYYELSQTPD
jgi:hypothetical protein